jgi:hypothetical protein
VKAILFTLTAKVKGYIVLGLAKKGEFATDYIGGWYGFYRPFVVTRIFAPIEFHLSLVLCVVGRLDPQV